MINIQVNTFNGLIGAQLIYNFEGNPDGVQFVFDAESVAKYGESQAIRMIKDAIRQARVDCICSETSVWQIDLDRVET